MTSFIKPRVTWCDLTRKWIVVPSGRRHVCSYSWKPDQAFRFWADAMAEANAAARSRIAIVRAREAQRGE